MTRLSALSLAIALAAPTAALAAEQTTQPSASQRLIDPADIDQLPVAKGGPAVGTRDDDLEALVLVDGPMPTTFDVAEDGTIYAAFPRWRDPVNVAVARIDAETGTMTAFPDAETNAYVPGNTSEYEPSAHFVCVQAVRLDAKGRLWVLDTGAVNMGTVENGGAKLVGYDTETGDEIARVVFEVGPDAAVHETSYLNDVRFDLDRGDDGVAFITDSGAKGGIVVVDLATGEVDKKLEGHASTLADDGVQLIVEGEPLLMRAPGEEPKPVKINSDGIAIDAERGFLYYTALTGRELHRVPLDALLAEGDASDAVEKVADMDSANDGIVADADGRIYTTDFEDNAIRRIDPQSGESDIVIQDERLLWPDCVIVRDGRLYVSSNQLNRQPQFHENADLRERPFAIFTKAVSGADRAD